MRKSKKRVYQDSFSMEIRIEETPLDPDVDKWLDVVEENNLRRI